ncbi:MAG: hypothetical protein SNJ70_08905, partial [Armatimonadota bacterium]
LQLSNRCVNNNTWVYAGIQMDRYYDNHELLEAALQAAAASTQGIMVFDYSHRIDQFWPIFEKAFKNPVEAPHKERTRLSKLRKKLETEKLKGYTEPPVIIQQGLPGTGL